QMRRGVDVHAVAGGLETGAERRHRRTLAVGAGHVDHGRQAALGISEGRQQPLDAVEGEVDELRMELREPLQNAVAAQEAASGRGSNGTTSAGGVGWQSMSRMRASVSCSSQRGTTMST